MLWPLLLILPVGWEAELSQHRMAKIELEGSLAEVKREREAATGGWDRAQKAVAARDRELEEVSGQLRVLEGKHAELVREAGAERAGWEESLTRGRRELEATKAERDRAVTAATGMETELGVARGEARSAAAEHA